MFTKLNPYTKCAESVHLCRILIVNEINEAVEDSRLQAKEVISIAVANK